MSSLSLVKHIREGQYHPRKRRSREGSTSTPVSSSGPASPQSLRTADAETPSDAPFYRVTEASQSAPSLPCPVPTDTQLDWPPSNITLATTPSTTTTTIATMSAIAPITTVVGAVSTSASASSSHGPLPPRSHERSLSYTPSLPMTKESLRLERRFQALLELHDKEVSYLRDLRVLVYVHLDAVHQAPFVTTDHKKMIRRNVEQVLELGERMGRRLQLAVGSKLEAWRTDSTCRDEDEVEKVIERVAKAFVSESPIFAVYEEFCAYHTEATDLIRQTQAMPEWALWVEHHRSQERSDSPAGAEFVSSTPTSQNRQNRLSVVDLARAASIHSRLTLLETVIKPVQQVTRYPMLLGSLLAQMFPERGPSEVKAKERVSLAFAAMKSVAESVNEAKRARDAEKKTEMIAARMELHSSYRAACVTLLGRIQLVGSLHVLYHSLTLDQSDSFKIKYHGIFLYQTHLVIVKVKRTTVYEPRHWFPIRYFEVVDVPDSSSIMPHSFSLKYQYHTFEFGATCEQEKKYWVDQLRNQISAIQAMREACISNGVPLNDDSIISSINVGDTTGAPFESQECSQESGAPSSPVLTTTCVSEPSRTTDVSDEAPTTPTMTSIPLGSIALPSPTSSSVSQRFSRNVYNLLGRTPAVAQAAIDLKLTEVFSDSLLAIRTQATREAATEAEDTVRRRTVSSSTPKRPSLNYLSVGRHPDKRMKRMTMVDFSSSEAVLLITNTCEPVPPVPHPASGLKRCVSPDHGLGAMNSWGDAPRASVTVEEVDMSARLGAEESAERASVERAGSSGSTSSASSAGPVTPRAVSIPLGAPHVVVRSTIGMNGGATGVDSSGPSTPSLTIGSVSSPSSEGFFATMFSKRKGSWISKTTPPSSVDLSFIPAPPMSITPSPLSGHDGSCTPSTDSGLADKRSSSEGAGVTPQGPAVTNGGSGSGALSQDSRTASGSWLPGLALARKLSRSARRVKADSPYSSTATSPSPLPSHSHPTAPLPLPPPPPVRRAASSASSSASVSRRTSMTHLGRSVGPMRKLLHLQDRQDDHHIMYSDGDGDADVNVNVDVDGVHHPASLETNGDDVKEDLCEVQVRDIRYQSEADDDTRPQQPIAPTSSPDSSTTTTATTTTGHGTVSRHQQQPIRPSLPKTASLPTESKLKTVSLAHNVNGKQSSIKRRLSAGLGTTTTTTSTLMKNSLASCGDHTTAGVGVGGGVGGGITRPDLPRKKSLRAFLKMTPLAHEI